MARSGHANGGARRKHDGGSVSHASRDAAQLRPRQARLPSAAGDIGGNMKKRTSSLPLVVLIAVVALVLGTFGTATAAGLTTKQVKKIATKVVNKKAKTLTVANANNATN